MSFSGDLRWVARFGLMSQISVSQIEAPIGHLFQKYVYSTFMVKMRIYRTLLVCFRLGTMHEEGICQI